MAGSLDEDVEKPRRSPNDLPQPPAERFSFLILASDTLRKILFPSPHYSENENKRLFSACHVLIQKPLKKEIPVIFDARNLLDHHREFFYRAARRAGAKLILVWVEAPAEVVRQQLLAREEAPVPDDDWEAGWQVYNKVKPRKEKISRNHLVVDTSQVISAVIDKIVRATKR